MKYGFARSGAAKKNVLVCYTPLDLALAQLLARAEAVLGVD